jgi:hypothetical protein
VGKAADNERHKLFATFLNNVAVAALVAGLVVPIFTIMLNKETSDLHIMDALAHDGFRLAAKCVVTAVCFAIALRLWASTVIGKIRD